MARAADALYKLCIALWSGAMLALGYVAAPVLFNRIEDRGFAGSIAGDMFTALSWIGLLCATYLLLFLFARNGLRALRLRVFWIVLAMLVLVVAGHFGIQPILTQLRHDALPRQVMESALRDRFATWHGLSSGLFLVQSLLALLLVVWQDRGSSTS